MATGSSDAELGSTLSWVMALWRRWLAGLFVWGLLTITVAAPALLLVTEFAPRAVPFVHLTVAGLVLLFLRMNLSEEEEELFIEYVEKLQAYSPSERFVYITSWVVILVAAISLEVAVIGLVATVLAQQGPLAGIAAIGVAMLGPFVDQRLGRYVGWNLASTGGLLMTVAMQAVAILSSVSPSVPRAAALQLRTTIQG